MPKPLRCPVCDQQIKPDRSEATLPFCSSRCKRIDAVRWLEEGYGLPVAEKDEEERESGTDGE